VPTLKRKTDFFETEKGLEIEQMLHTMAADMAFNTESGYTANAVRYPDNVISFIDKHKDYLIAHPAIDPKLYMANLRLKTRLR
jgi:hypothetical protein